MVPSRMLQAKVDAPHTVEVPRGRKTVPIDIRTELTNVGEADYVVHAAGPDHMHFWHVLDENHREVARGKTGPPKGSSRKFLAKTIAAGLSAHDTHRLSLPTQRLKDGKTYTLRSEIFGQMAETRFIVVRPERTAPVRPSKKKTAKKKAAKKKAAKKKAAKKKAAKKKATKKKATKKKATKRKAAKAKRR